MTEKKTPVQKDEKLKAVKTSMSHPMTDPQGMYTGVPDDPYEVPVQDADDL